MSPLTSHVLDTARGEPARNLRVQLERLEANGQWRRLAERVTNDDGRVLDLLPEGALEARTYRLIFATGDYLLRTAPRTFFPEVTVVFSVQEPSQHYHVPLLLSPFGYSTYRGN
jgi:5-hydroxyisourate hydrolase